MLKKSFVITCGLYPVKKLNFSKYIKHLQEVTKEIAEERGCYGWIDWPKKYSRKLKKKIMKTQSWTVRICSSHY